MDGVFGFLLNHVQLYTNTIVRPNGTSLVATYERSLSNIQNLTNFPAVPGQSTFSHILFSSNNTNTTQIPLSTLVLTPVPLSLAVTAPTALIQATPSPHPSSSTFLMHLTPSTPTSAPTTSATLTPTATASSRTATTSPLAVMQAHRCGRHVLVAPS